MKRKPAVSIRFKLCCSYMALVLLPTILAGVLLYTHTVGNIWEQIDARLCESIEEQTTEIRRKIQQVEEAARNFITLNEITQYVSGLYFDESELIIAYNQRVRAAFPGLTMRLSFQCALAFLWEAMRLRRTGTFTPKVPMKMRHGFRP